MMLANHLLLLPCSPYFFTAPSPEATTTYSPATPSQAPFTIVPPAALTSLSRISPASDQECNLCSN